MINLYVNGEGEPSLTLRLTVGTIIVLQLKLASGVGGHPEVDRPGYVVVKSENLYLDIPQY